MNITISDLRRTQAQSNPRNYVHQMRFQNASTNKSESKLQFQVETLKKNYYKVKDAYNRMDKRWSTPIPAVPTKMDRGSIGMNSDTIGSHAYHHLQVGRVEKVLAGISIRVRSRRYLREYKDAMDGHRFLRNLQGNDKEYRLQRKEERTKY